MNKVICFTLLVVLSGCAAQSDLAYPVYEEPTDNFAELAFFLSDPRLEYATNVDEKKKTFMRNRFKHYSQVLIYDNAASCDKPHLAVKKDAGTLKIDSEQLVTLGFLYHEQHPHTEQYCSNTLSFIPKQGRHYIVNLRVDALGGQCTASILDKNTNETVNVYDRLKDFNVCFDFQLESDAADKFATGKAYFGEKILYD